MSKQIHLLFLALSLPFFLFAQNNADSLCVKNSVFRVVVLGSSTAAGAGPSSLDSAWVNRYRKAITAINPSNTVVNLAQGGYSTYQLQPSDFVPPVGRPLPDTLRNITRALALLPDAIVVNLPSNDTGSGVLPAEQLENFERIVQKASDAGVQIWVATTQPKNFTNSTLIGYQQEVRDSIFARYGDHAIDFWTPFATPTGTLDSIYDSGDGTHMNDAAHAILEQKVLDKNILDAVFTAADKADFALLNLRPKNEAALCGAENEAFFLDFVNFGATDSFPSFRLFLNGDTLPPYPVFATIESCSFHSFEIDLPTSEGGNFFFEGDFGFFFDANFLNNALEAYFSREKQPSLMSEDRHACLPTSFVLEANFSNAEQLTWYEDAEASLALGSDSPWLSPFISENTTLYAQASRDTFMLTDSLYINAQINRDWNGMMFELVAKNTVQIDGITVPINTLGLQNVLIYQKTGSIVGFENDSTVWQQTDLVEIEVTEARTWTLLPIQPFELQAGDTMAFYILMESPGGQLNYGFTSNSDTIPEESNSLILQRTTGISHRFQDLYYPRHFIGKIQYQEKKIIPKGCVSPIDSVLLSISNLTVDLGPDTLLVSSPTVLLDAGSGYASYEWSNGFTTQSISVDSINLSSDCTEIWVKVSDNLGCTAADTLCLKQISTSIFTAQSTDYQVFPNPCTDKVSLFSRAPEGTFDILVYDIFGKTLVEKTGWNGLDLDVSWLGAGVYFMRLTGDTKLVLFFNKS